jgi:uncharacterized protein
VSTPVTIQVRRKVKPGREAAYEAWLQRLAEGAQRDFEGYLGADFVRPGPDRVYRNVFRFDTLEHLERFERSEFRLHLMREGAQLFESDAAWERMTGLEFWFDPPAGTQVPKPHPHRMVLVMIIVISVLAVLLGLTLGRWMAAAQWPLLLRTLVTVAVQTSLMSYLIMPRLTPHIAHFIYPSRTEHGAV